MTLLAQATAATTSPADTKAKLALLLGTWSRPPDLPAKIALGFAAFFLLIAILGRGRSLLGMLYEGDDAHADGGKTDRRRFLAIVSLAAGLVSIAYIATYLRGGPRIIDATTYFLQGRALSRGHFAWEPLEPTASFRGRFLDYAAASGGEGPTLGGIFPPGYPLLLSFGFMLGSPMLIGPLLAAALVFATYKLGRTVAEHSPRTSPFAEPIGRAAALLSLVCGALRYHTSDTMSHGASALGVTIALTCALRSVRAPPIQKPAEESPLAGGRADALLAGVAVGAVFATRPASALPLALVVGWLLRRRLALPLLGLVPGVLLLLVSQKAVTGSWLMSTQRMYYASSDGPPGCFRWGFGKDTGCIFEHGEFVHARLEHGYGPIEALGTTARRLRKHLMDVANLEPLALLVLGPLALRRRLGGATQAATALLAIVLLQVLSYAPFYFDGDYPGGGARFFADVLPVEHVLVATTVALVARSEIGFARGAYGVISLALIGFGVHAAYEHGLLRDREGGRPYFEPDVLARASVTSGLVFVDSDHGFALGHDPSVRSVKDRVLVARLRSDDRDRMLYEALDRPPTWLYKIEPPVPPSTETTPTLTPWAPPDFGTWTRLEGESEWPALSQEGGFAAPGFTDSCASNRRALILTPTPSTATAKATIEIPVLKSGRYLVELHLVFGRIPHAPTPTVDLSAGLAGRTQDDARATLGDVVWTWKTGLTCVALPAREADLTAPSTRLTVEALGNPVGLDFINLRPK